MNDTSESHGVSPVATALMMGEIRSDVKHILNSLPQFRKDMENMELRLTKVESYNMRVLGMAAVAIPVMTLVVNWFVAYGIPRLILGG